MPFDERGNEAIKIEDISGIRVFDHLKTVGSKLVNELGNKSLIDILDMMDLLTGPLENRQIKNVAAMMFCDHPEKFFPVTQIDIVHFPEGSIENPDVMIEAPKITGPVPKMINETLSYLRTNVIKQRITKPSGTEKSAKVYNYPYQALEEAVVNALYHRDYKEREPVEITIEPTHIDILSYAGPDRSISYEAIKAARKLKARRYRNRRLGDFLKELDLTEGRATGIPTIQKHLRLNGNQLATIDTDDDRSYFLITIPCREDMAGTQQAEVSGKHTAADFDAQLSHEFGKAYAKVQQIASQCEAENKAELLQLLLQMAVKVWNRSRHSDDKVYYCQAAVNLLQMLRNRLATLREISLELGYPETYELRRKIITPLIEFGYISMTNPEKPKSSKQAYRLSARGQRLFK